MARLACILALLLLCGPLRAAIPGLDGGHTKLRGLATTYPDDSLFRDSAGATAYDEGAGLRLKFSGSHQRFSIKADYQLIAQFGDSLELPREVQGLFLVPQPAPEDQNRWWDLTDQISEGNSRLVVQRLDRLHLDYSGDKTVIRFGRQAVSWGNGLIYSPMDFLNPFDPAAVDTEYKVGDDMLYGQYLLDNGSDWQLVSVQRRDEDGNVSSEVSSTALKFHGFGLEWEYDLLLAEHYDQFMLGVGGAANVGDAVLRSDIVLTDARDGWETTLVANWSYSWVWGGYNISGVAEYFFNGFGLRESDYDLQQLQEDQDLVQRLARGELFTLGRQYLAGSLLVEVTPLVNVTPNLFVNLGDGSALAQLVLQWNLAQDWQLLGALTAPLGSTGTEYGGLETERDDRTLEVGPSLFAQIAWYF
jgi:hypothetical protein